MKSDLVIKNRLLKDISQRSLDSITVSSICEELKIKRQTFYYYFRDIYDVIESILDDYAQDLLDNEISSLYLIRVLDFIENNYQFFKEIFNSNLYDLVIKFLNNLFSKYIKFLLINLNESNTLSSLELNEIISYHTNGISSYIYNEISTKNTFNVSSIKEKISIFVCDEILLKNVKDFNEKRNKF